MVSSASWGPGLLPDRRNKMGTLRMRLEDGTNVNALRLGSMSLGGTFNASANFKIAAVFSAMDPLIYWLTVGRDRPTTFDSSAWVILVSALRRSQIARRRCAFS